MLKYMKYHLKTKNDYLKTQIKHSLYIPLESCNNKNSSPRYVNSCMSQKMPLSSSAKILPRKKRAAMTQVTS